MRGALVGLALLFASSVAVLCAGRRRALLAPAARLGARAAATAPVLPAALRFQTAYAVQRPPAAEPSDAKMRTNFQFDNKNKLTNLQIFHDISDEIYRCLRAKGKRFPRRQERSL